MGETRETPGRGRWIWVVAVAGIVVAGVSVGAWWLVDPLSAETPADKASALQATFTLAFGFGGVATLALFARRQWHQERVHEHDRAVAAEAQYDAEQRRITEQYVKAVELLGHESASVRLAGLYALDRLGRNHPEQRQMISEVWCAYLRRRYRPPRAVLLGTSADDALDLQFDGEAGPGGADELEALDEYEVRATAQRLLARHLRDPRPAELRNGERPPASEEYWDLQRIDLTKATLVSMDFRDCVFPRTDAGGLRCHRRAQFDRAVFTSKVLLERSKFHGGVSFFDTHLADDVSFLEATFLDRVTFRNAKFSGGVRFERAVLTRTLDLRDSWFETYAVFEDCELAGKPAVDLTGARATSDPTGFFRRAWPPGWVAREADPVDIRGQPREPFMYLVQPDDPEI
ncbi:pentapeptide repeat-containing protein [Glycomyces niveus]|uniref:Pentapeptide repeat-containing protein n=1 Tax=Glycomyces niveus TaxID=2820287 RepID=A0ABS3U1X1_9ACTN|nr:pentapeptide repeat-containing protein [Glycomyces sp. NEAU-S30]MBO3732780.1 pentapeptide repeat-containing protein [Glycomyces sp. NEAU-S30]